jgi:hypothetical protein
LKKSNSSRISLNPLLNHYLSLLYTD